MSTRRTRLTVRQDRLTDWGEQLLSRRRFLFALAGGSVAALMPLTGHSAIAPAMDVQQRWSLLDAVQNHLLPSEPDAPGASEIQALKYLRFVVADTELAEDDRAFILRGPEWLEDLTRQAHDKSFIALSEAEKEGMLRRVASSEVGENWISTLQLYLCEAMIADPVYGGNPNGIGWKWLGHNPGFPRPTSRNRYGAG